MVEAIKTFGDKIEYVLLKHSLEHINNESDLFYEIDKKLVKGGVIEVIVPNQSQSSVNHYKTNIGIDHFYALRNKYDIKVYKGHKLGVKQMLLRNFKSLRDWLFRRFYDEYKFILMKR